MRAPLLAALLATGAAACESNNPTTPDPPTTPSTTTETFTGSLNINGAATFPFTVATAGAVTATLTTVEPDATIPIGLSLGTWNGTLCSVGSGLFNDNALQGAVVTGSAGSLGSLCVRVYDSGKVTGAMTYSVTVVHP
jgi:hypothetical protein